MAQHEGSIQIRPDAPLAKVRLTLDERVDDFLRRMEYRHRVSKSAVVETALLRLMAEDEDTIERILRSTGATLRRR